MNTPKFLETATRLLDAVEHRLLSPDSFDPIGPKEWLWLGRALRAIQNEPFQDSEEVRPVGNRLIDLVARVREEDINVTLEEAFLSTVKAVTSDNGMTLARCLKRDDAMSLQTIADYFCDDIICWDSTRWEDTNGISEEEQCTLLAEFDASVDQRPAPELRTFDGATASFDPSDPCGDGWLACLAHWSGNQWWVGYVRADLAEVLARSATNHDEAGVALVMMPEVPTEAREEWTSFVKDLVTAGVRGVQTGIGAEALIDEADGVESEY